jgi:hypothetical protein
MRCKDSLVLLPLVVGIAVSGCTKMNDHAVDPPELNPHPVQRVQLYVSAAPSLKVRVGADYRIGSWLGLFGGGGEYCGPDVDAPPDAIMHERPGTTVPINFNWDGSGYRGEFFIDRFLPGRCHWTFSSLDTLSPTWDFVSSFNQERTNFNFDTAPYGNTYDQSPVQEADLWCGLDPSPREGETGKMLCTSLKYFVLYPGTVANELIENIPVSQIYNEPRVNLFPFTTSVTLRYHDLAAENRAVTATVSTQGNRRQTCPLDGVRIYVDAKNQIIVNGINIASDKLFMHLRGLTPAPKRVCYALAASRAGPPLDAMTVLTDVGILKLALALYADDSFTTPVQIK